MGCSALVANIVGGNTPEVLDIWDSFFTFINNICIITCLAFNLLTSSSESVLSSYVRVLVGQEMLNFIIS